MKKNGIRLLLALALVLACAAPALAEGVTLTLMANANDAAKSYMTSIIEQYEVASGNEIELIPIEQDSFDSIAADRFASGDVPDIFQHFNNSSLNNYAVSENFRYLNDQPWVSDLTKGALDYSVDGEGNLLGLPFWESSVSGCYYNRTILEELGLAPATSQEEFNALCDTLVEEGYIPLCWPAGDCDWMYQFALDPVFSGDGGEKLAKLNRNEIAYADVPEVRAMAEWLRMAASRGWFGDTFLTDGWSDISRMLGAGKAVMTMIWDTWFYTDFDESYGYTRDDFSVMPVFMGTCDAGTFEGGNLNMLMINKNGANVDAALEFLSFCATPENYNAAFADIATVSVFRGESANIQSAMVTENLDAINALQRTSTAEPKIVGYVQSDAGRAVRELLMGNVDPAGCVELMDEYRIAFARALGVEGF